MGIYNVSGASLGLAYDIDSSELATAYDYEGSVVYSKSPAIPDYDSYSYTQKWASKGISNAQGFDIYDGKVFWVSKSGNSPVDNKMYVFNLSNGSSAVQGEYITAYGGHGNNVTFSKEFLAQGDNYPLVVMSTAYDYLVYLNRISNSFVATLEKTYTIPSIPNITNGGLDICYGETDDVAYTATVFGSNSDPQLGTHICIAKWDMTDLTENQDGSFTPAFISSVNCDWHYWKQGIKYHDGLIWLASGYPGYNAYVYAIDPNTGETKHIIDCETTTEIEGAVWYPDAQAVGGYALYVGFSGMMLRKYTFAST